MLFLSEDDIQFLHLRFFLIINDYLFEKYEYFSDYIEYEKNFYYLYYKFILQKNLGEFKEEILSKIDPDNFAKFSFDKNVLNEQYVAKLTLDLDSLKNNNKCFNVQIDEKLVNNPLLLQIFNLGKIDTSKIKNFFKYSIITDNYYKYLKNKNENFVLSVDELNFQDDKLHVFNIFFLIACGLVDKIDKDSLQIFNEGNKVLELFKKFAIILMENINKIISNIKNKNKNDYNTEEIFGFGKIFNTFYVLYTNLNDINYTAEKLKFDMMDNSLKENINGNNVIKIKVKINKSENDTNFTKIKESSNKDINEEDLYYEKVNSGSLEDVCKEYIFSKINDLINENIGQIEFIEMYKILFGLNFFIPYVDENYSLKFIPISKTLNNLNMNQQEYGYQEFDCMFKVLGAEDIPMNQENAGNKGLPFVKSLEIKIRSWIQYYQIQYDVYLGNEKEFYIKKNSLVIVENKIRLKKEKIMEYITIMLKKLNFVIKLIKNTTKDFDKYHNIQLLLIYDDIIFNSNDLKALISVDQIKSILKDICFFEIANFNLEIIYISQSVNVFNISRSFKEMTNMKNKMNKMEKKMNIQDNKIKRLENTINKLIKFINEKGFADEININQVKKEEKKEKENKKENKEENEEKKGEKKEEENEEENDEKKEEEKRGEEDEEEGEVKKDGREK